MKQTDSNMSLIRRDVLENVERVLLAGLIVVVLAIASLSVHAFFKWKQTTEPVPVVSVGTVVPTPVPSPALEATPLSDVQPTSTLPPSEPTEASPTQIGVVAGHWESDVGAVCEDGLQEVDINLAVAQRVVTTLLQSGYQAEILAEFSPNLQGYHGAALISIHADACNVPEASGFKVARVSASVVPELEDRLVACLVEKYHQATGLDFHRNSITFDMTEYHAFYEIAPETPAAIIETGFMGADRQLLTKEQDRVALGIVNGIKCFMASTQ
jgi:N-acetylmuramoyl-L-alanine amidase